MQGGRHCQTTPPVEGFSFPVEIVVICTISLGAGGGTRTHTRLPSPDFESGKDCAMVRDAALRCAFMSLFAFLCGIERDQVRPECHQRCHQKHAPDRG